MSRFNTLSFLFLLMKKNNLKKLSHTGNILCLIEIKVLVLKKHIIIYDFKIRFLFWQKSWYFKIKFQIKEATYTVFQQYFKNTEYYLHNLFTKTEYYLLNLWYQSNLKCFNNQVILWYRFYDTSLVNKSFNTDVISSTDLSKQRITI